MKQQSNIEDHLVSIIQILINLLASLVFALKQNILIRSNSKFFPNFSVINHSLKKLFLNKYPNTETYFKMCN